MITVSDRFSRTELILGKDAIKKLASSRVAVFGVGGVGGYAVEALARSGVGALDLIDSDKICLSNINRQIIATQNNIGQYKVDEAKRRVLSINPDCVVRTYKIFYLPETEDMFDFSQYDYVVDAIDTVSGKLALVENAKKTGTPVISSMGAGNKLDPTAFRVADIYSTSVDPLARIMRYECRKRKIDKLKVVYSCEKPLCPKKEETSEGKGENLSDVNEKSKPRRSVPGSTAFVPSVVGLIIAGEVIKDLTGINAK